MISAITHLEHFPHEVDGNSPAPGTEAQYKRQKDDGTNFVRKVKCPDVIGTYQKAAGVVDEHNRFRQGVLRLEYFWKTKQYEKRMLVCMLSTCMVNAFHAWEYELGPDVHNDDTKISSRIIRFVVLVIDAILPSLQEGPASPSQTSNHPCQLETIDKQVTTTGSNVGHKYAITRACTQCVKHKRRNGKGGKRARTTAFRCRVHKDVYLCNSDHGTCLVDHQTEIQAMYD